MSKMNKGERLLKTLEGTLESINQVAGLLDHYEGEGGTSIFALSEFKDPFMGLEFHKKRGAIVTLPLGDIWDEPHEVEVRFGEILENYCGSAEGGELKCLKAMAAQIQKRIEKLTPPMP